MTPKSVFVGGAAFLNALAALWALPAVAGEIFVTHGNKIGAYTTSGATVNASLITGLSQPSGVAVSGSDLYVTNFNTGTIGQYTTSGATLNASFVTGLGSADFVAVSGNDLFVSTAGYNTVGEYDATTGAAINASLITGLSYPGPLAVSGGNVYVSQDTHTIAEYTTSGTLVDATLVTAPNPVYGIAVSGNDLFVDEAPADRESPNTIAEYDATTGALINSALVGAPGLGGAVPLGITVSGGDLFVVAGATSIAEFDATTGATVNGSLVTGLTNAYGIAVTPEPSTWILLAIGAAALLACGLRKRGPQSRVGT